MNKDKRIVVKIMFACMGSFIAGSILTSIFGSVTTEAQTSLKYNHLHIRAGGCKMGRDYWQGVVDLRNGNAWCVPTGGGKPEFEGTLNLSAITERPPATP